MLSGFKWYRFVKPSRFVLVGSVFVQSDHRMDDIYGKSEDMPTRQTVGVFDWLFLLPFQNFTFKLLGLFEDRVDRQVSVYLLVNWRLGTDSQCILSFCLTVLYDGRGHAYPSRCSPQPLHRFRRGQRSHGAGWTPSCLGCRGGGLTESGEGLPPICRKPVDCGSWW